MTDFRKMFAEHLNRPLEAQASEWFSTFWDAYDDNAAADDYNPLDNLPVLIGAAKMIGAMLASTNGLECERRGVKLSDHCPMEVIMALGTQMLAEYHRQVEMIEGKI